MSVELVGLMRSGSVWGASMVSFLDPTVKGVRDATTDGLIVI